MVTYGHSPEAPKRWHEPARNLQFDWDLFDSGWYHRHNYAELRADDARIVALVGDWFAGTADPCRGDGLDVGAGPNLYPALAMAPNCADIDLWEHSRANVAWLEQQVAELPESWEAFWDVVSPQGERGSFAAVRAQFRARIRVTQGSIFDLPRERWGIGTMFFVAESMTEDPVEFHAAVDAFLLALRPLAPFAAAFMEYSEGYAAGSRFPGCPVDAAGVARALGGRAASLAVRRIAIDPAPLRPGYTGMILATGLRSA
jgi:hypothetical protein